jgi:hypothetical protein
MVQRFAFTAVEACAHGAAGAAGECRLMNPSNETRAFLALFLELDGSLSQQRQDVTEAAIEVLFDRVLNPPMLDNDMPTLDDVEAAERQLIALVKAEATRVRDYIRGARNVDPDD